MNNIKLVKSYVIKSKEELLKYHKQFLSEGYEGTMVRYGDDGYKINGRSSSLLKLKDFQDIACKIIDVVPSEKRPDQGQFICEYKGHQFGCGMSMSHKEREDILINASNYIGEIAEIRFLEYTDDGVPRFPICVGLRLDR